MVESDTLAIVARYLMVLRGKGLEVRFAVVFGSTARGTAQEWSDIDLLVVSPHFDRRSARSDIDLLWHVAARVDSRIEPIPCGERQWETDSSSAIIEIARREGYRVAGMMQ